MALYLSMTLDLFMVILCGINVLRAIVNRNYWDTLGWLVGGLGFLRCYLM